MNFIETFFEHVTEKSRQTLIETTQGDMIYSDSAQHYVPVKPEFIRSVSSVGSFAQYVVKEAKRRKYTEGENMTVLFDLTGGIAYLDENKQRDKITYRRSLAQQFEALSSFCDGSSYTHIHLLRGLQGLRPSIMEYDEFMRHYRAVSFKGSETVVSQPIVMDGEAGRTIDFKLQVKGGTQDNVNLPTELELEFPFTRGGDSTTYLTTIVIEMLLKDGEPRFRPLFYERENIIEQALKDELNDFKEAMQEADLKETLVALNY